MSGNVYRLSKTMKSVGNNLWLWVKTLKRDCGSLAVHLNRYLRFIWTAKSRLNGSISFLIENSWGKRRANVSTRVLVSLTNLVCGSKCHLDISGTNVPQGAVHSGWPAVQMCQKSRNNVIWCQETFTDSQKRWKVLETIFGCGSKHLKGTAVHLRFIWTATCGSFEPRNLAWMGLYHF